MTRACETERATFVSCIRIANLDQEQFRFQSADAFYSRLAKNIIATRGALCVDKYIFSLSLSFSLSPEIFRFLRKRLYVFEYLELT